MDFINVHFNGFQRASHDKLLTCFLLNSYPGKVYKIYRKTILRWIPLLEAYNSTKNDSAAVLMGRNRSSHQRCSLIKDVLRNFTKFTGKHLCQSLFFSIKKMYTNNILKNNFGAEYLTVLKKSIKTNQFHLLNVIQKLNRC